MLHPRAREGGETPASNYVPSNPFALEWAGGRVISTDDDWCVRRVERVLEPGLVILTAVTELTRPPYNPRAFPTDAEMGMDEDDAWGACRTGF